MAINSMASASKYTDALDKVVVQEAQTGFFADNIMTAKFVGAKTVIIPDMDFKGLADYNRDNGFSRSGLTVAQTSYTLTKDRGRQIQIDREDMDETGVANLAGQVLGEYVRTQVVPEIDAYVLSKLAGIASTNGHKVEFSESTAVSQLIKVINDVQSRAGYSEELVAFVDSVVYAELMTSPELSRQIIISDFKKGDINVKVRSLNGVAIIPVAADRMRDSYTFTAGTAATSSAVATGGFTPAPSAGYIRALVLPKKGASLCKKTVTLRTFTPEENKDADAYVFNYRIYYDLLVKKSNIGFVDSIISKGT